MNIELHFGSSRREPVIIISSQSSFHPFGLKEFIIWTDKDWDRGRFRVKDLYGNFVREGDITRYGLHIWAKHNWTVKLKNFTTSGKYLIEVYFYGNEQEEKSSVGFEIDENVYIRIAKLVVGWYHIQRCGTAVEGWHKACHVDDALLRDFSQDSFGKPIRYIDCRGGWHDAGDCNKWIQFPWISIYALCELQTRLSPDWCDYKETLPDVLSEIRWGTEFILKMQKDDGSFYLAVAGWHPQRKKSGWVNSPMAWFDSNFEEDTGNEINPEKTRLLSDEWENQTLTMGYDIVNDHHKDKALHTANLAVALSRSASVFLSVDRDFSNRCLMGAKKALNWSKSTTPFSHNLLNYYASIASSCLWIDSLEPNEDLKYLTEKCIKFILSQQDKQGFFSSFIKYFHDPFFYIIVLLEFIEKYPDSGLSSHIMKSLKKLMEVVENLTQGSPFGQMMSYSPFGKPTNLAYLREGFKLDPYSSEQGYNPYFCAVAYISSKAALLFNEQKYAEIAERQIQWILGKNPRMLSMVVGIGNNPNIYHTRYRGIKGHEDGVLPGGVLSGMLGGNGKEFPEDYPIIDQRDKPTTGTSWSYEPGNYQTNEYWCPNNAWFLLGIIELMEYFNLK